MSFYLLHAGTSLQRSTAGGILTTIALPAGQYMVSSRPIRAAALAGEVVIVNAVSRNIVLNPADLSTRLLSITGPAAALTAAASGAGNLKGKYRWGYTYAIINNGIILTESPMSPLSNPVDFNNHSGSLSAVTTSSTAGVTHRIVYRTTDNGTELYESERIANNSGTTVTDNNSDYDLGLLPVAEGKGNPPGNDTNGDRLRLIVSWKDRLFAAPHFNPDYLYISGNREIYSWSETDRLTVPSKGEDSTGVTAFMARRDELVIAKRRKLWKLIGTSPDDFELILVADGIGAMNQESSIVVHDTCYFLAEDGFYEYGTAGLKKLSGERVQPWFTTDTYFNRAYFDNAFCKYNQLYDRVELHMVPAGGTTLTKWVEYDIKSGAWFGLHTTGSFTPTCAGAMDDSNGFSTPVIGSSAGYLYRQNQTAAADDASAIDMDVTTKFLSGGNPDYEHYWDQPTVLNKIESSGTLTVTPKVGDLDASAQSGQSVDLTNDRTVLPRLGYGRFCQLRFQNSTINIPVTIYGVEIPFFDVGRR